MKNVHGGACVRAIVIPRQYGACGYDGYMAGGRVIQRMTGTNFKAVSSA